jgi:predicted transcriptional regulator
VFIPTVSQESKRVLHIIKEHGVCSGRQLRAEAGLADDELVAAIKELVGSELVSSSGGTFGVKEIGHAYFNIRPSNSSLAEFVLKT